MVASPSSAEAYDHFEVGSNYRLSEPAAELLLAQMDGLLPGISERMEQARLLTEQLSQIKGISLPTQDSYVEKHSWFLYLICSRRCAKARFHRSRTARQRISGTQSISFFS